MLRFVFRNLMLRYIKIDCILSKIDKSPLEFMGSTLRGAFGVSLKKVSCINPNYECLGCFAQKNCLYYNFFEVKNKFHSYRFSKALADENFDFTLYLFEDSCEKLPFILSALKEMITIQGLGVERKLFQIESITCNGVQVLNGHSFDLGAVIPKEFEINDYSNCATLFLKTPLRIKSENKLLRSKPSLEQILASIFNRISEIKGLPLEKLPFKPEYQELQSNINFHDLTRYSNRQQTKMQIGGILGHICYTNLDTKSYQLLKLGEILGVGKQTVFGLGEIKIDNN